MTTPYTLQQNGIVARKNRVLIEVASAMVSNLGLGHDFWGEALLTASYVLNRVSNNRRKTTSYEF